MVMASTVLSFQPRPRTDSNHGWPHRPAERVALTMFLHGARGVGRWLSQVIGATAGLADQAPSATPLTPPLLAPGAVAWTGSSPRSATTSPDQSGTVSLIST